MAKMEQEDSTSFRNFLRVDMDFFRELIVHVGPRVEKQDTFFRKAIPPALRLAMTLRYLATGDSHYSLQYSFRVAHNTISEIVYEICEAIISEYTEVMPCPRTCSEWKEVAIKFEKKWNLPHTPGALDGKHIAIHCLPNTGSKYFNYKGFH